MDVDTTGFEKLSDREFLDRISYYIGAEFVRESNRNNPNPYVENFGFIADLVIDGVATICESHALSFKGYNPETKQVTLCNPHTSNEDIVIPLEIAQKYFDISID